MNKHKEKQRKLTKAEWRRKERFEQMETALSSQGYQKKDLTIGLVFANVMALVLCLPVIIVFFIAFFMRNAQFYMEGDTGREGPLLLLVWIILIVVHELIHGMTWAIFAPSHWKSIEFGFIVKYLTPYCTCGEPLKKQQHIIGALMPTLVLGILPAVIAVFSGSMFWLLTGCLMILSGGGDLTIILKLLLYRSKGKDVVYIDHPYQAGVIAFER